MRCDNRNQRLISTLGLAHWFPYYPTAHRCNDEDDRIFLVLTRLACLTGCSAAWEARCRASTRRPMCGADLAGKTTGDGKFLPITLTDRPAPTSGGAMNVGGRPTSGRVTALSKASSSHRHWCPTRFGDIFNRYDNMMTITPSLYARRSR